MSSLDSSSMGQLAAEKIEARQKLLKLPPEEAQARVDRILHPSLWKVDVTQNVWEPLLSSQDDDD